MADSDSKPGKPPVVDSPLFKLIVQAAIPALLSVLVLLAGGIYSAQVAQGEKLSTMDGSLKVLVQQNTDFSGRLSKVESGVDENRRAIGGLDGRVLVLENLRHQ